MTKEKIKDLLYSTKVEIENELSDSEDLSNKEIDSAIKILDWFLNKANTYIDDEFIGVKTPLEQAIIDEIDMILNEYYEFKDLYLSDRTKLNIAEAIINRDYPLWEDLNNIIIGYLKKENDK